ncbi:hypothetical protein HOLleu_12255 [Holothuria leucospilota]|uniref:Integrase zinc-binding domain-containing protein n=1 Tax=Holothuria leucospilota TaxID=206669 RepID=A0A9Q1H9Z9_HOLLE|nr:hypothetical protein HOLleu_12255 [Holothuria leucospilota]
MQYTAGLAKDAIRGCSLIGGDKGYQQARSILETRFGNPHLVTEHIIHELRQRRQVRSPVDIQSLADGASNALLVLSNLGMLHELNSQSAILDIVGRLDTSFGDRWKKLALKTKKSSGNYPDFKMLVTFLSDLAAEVNDPVYGFCKKDKGYDKSKSTSATFAMSTQPVDGQDSNIHAGHKSSPYARPESPCILCGQTHRLWHCVNFKRLSPKDRLDIVIKNNLCHNCLLSTHQTSKCGKKSVCSVKGCGKKHTMYIHIDDETNVSTGQTDVTYMNDFVGKDVYMPVVVVTVNDTERVLALLDPGSSNSFCSERLSRNLGIKGKQRAYHLSTLNQCTSKKSEVVNFTVTSDFGETLNMSGVFVTRSIPARSSQVDWRSYEHLCDLDIPQYDSYQGVDLLIGQDHAEAFLPLEIRRGKRGEPFAIRSIMGWYLNGQIRPQLVNANVICHFVTALGKTAVLEDKINQLWLLENEGLEGYSWSDEDKSVMELWNQECRLIDGHYELPIPWKDRNDPLPNNYVVAKSRLDSLMKRLRGQDLVDRYQIEINKLLDNGYAEVVPYNEIHTARHVWYLPHHAVITEKKPDKLRVVFDCASRYGGKSLNERCKQGPNLINNLLHVLLRFRLHKFAFHADIEAMYNQVKIPIKDRDALRFLWYKNGRVLCMRMTSHLFGGIWCSSSSSFALRRTPVDCDYASPQVKDTVEKAFYVDDCLKSVSTKDDARMIIRDTPRVLRYGGFNLTKFIVNDLSILSDIPEELRAKEVKDLCPKAVGKVLGVQWNISDDTFFFTVKINEGQLVTRRNMLSMVSSVFDPLGLAGPLVVSGKLLFQEATRLKLGWDDPVPVTLEKQWTSWIQSLLSMNVIGLRDSRCVKPEGFDDAVIELHHFSDASKVAYGSCSYLRCVNKLGLIHTSLVVSKSKIAPLKQCTIPRLELQAAVLAAKVDKMLREELDIVIDRSYFWVDSEIVLKYINNDSRRFHVFVGNRVSMIRQLSSPCQWNFIPGKLNPADALSRGQALANLDQDIWFGGPNFLRGYKGNWSQVKCSNELVADDPEVRTKPVNLVSNIVGASGWEDPLSRISNYFSSWNKLKRIVAWWLRLIKVCRLRVPVKEVLSIKEVRKAEILLIKHVQQQHFSDEIARLLTGASVAKSSPLRLLIPFIDQDGLLRVGGRLIECKSIETRPYILSHLHPVSKAIVNEVHCKAHVGVEWTHSLVRQRYWILKARPLIKRLIHNCVTCRKLHGKPCTQFMGNLPLERIEPNKPPFAYVGIDVFGPFYVKLNRSEVKRYGCMFTCLVTRALHIEKLNSLDTEAFINGLRRFISRRGCPEKIFSDHALTSWVLKQN